MTAKDTTTMTAVTQDRYGPEAADVLRVGEIERPTPASDQVLVRVAAAGVDRGTWHLMTGHPLVARPAIGLRRPKVAVPGRDVAGTVVAVGDEVTDLAVGDEVYGSVDGSFAEYAVGGTDRLARKPAGLSFAEAAVVPISGWTGLQAVRDQARVGAGERVLVLGASGGVGSYVVQVAKAHGAEVTGVASTAKLDLVRGLGADHVVDYMAEDVTAGRERYDVVIDTGSNHTVRALRRLLTPKGRLVVVGTETDGRFFGGVERGLRAALLSPFVSQRLTMFLSSENSDDLRDLTTLIEDGKVRPALDRTYPLAEAAQAITDLAAGRVKGKVALEV